MIDITFRSAKSRYEHIKWKVGDKPPIPEHKICFVQCVSAKGAELAALDRLYEGSLPIPRINEQLPSSVNFHEGAAKAIVANLHAFNEEAGIEVTEDQKVDSDDDDLDDGIPDEG